MFTTTSWYKRFKFRMDGEWKIEKVNRLAVNRLNFSESTSLLKSESTVESPLQKVCHFILRK